jgi:hypothetical protein
MLSASFLGGEGVQSLNPIVINDFKDKSSALLKLCAEFHSNEPRLGYFDSFLRSKFVPALTDFLPSCARVLDLEVAGLEALESKSLNEIKELYLCISDDTNPRLSSKLQERYSLLATFARCTTEDQKAFLLTLSGVTYDSALQRLQDWILEPLIDQCKKKHGRSRDLFHSVQQ